MPRRRSGTTPLQVLYRRLMRAYGPQGWWPADSPFEMMVGAILTQATNWHNVEQAIGRLKQAGPVQPRRLLAMSRGRLERAIQPSGYFRQKADRLTAYTRWYLRRFGGSPRRMFRTSWRALRAELLARKGIGPETADSILLYAGNQPAFVVDAYTSRVFTRHRVSEPGATYDRVQQAATDALPARVKMYNECHALLVAVGKRHCHRRDPDCAHCPLGEFPHTNEVV